jgi:hypothetical protein
MQKLNNEVMKMMKSAVEMCASKYNFDGDEAMRMICESEGLSCSSSSRVNKRNVNKKEKREIVKSLFPLPYNGELNGECCFGIRQNSGLYTQCPSNRLEDKAYCGSCEKQATKNEHGLPDYGSIQTRLSKYNKDEEFVDPSGKKPVAYTKIMKKLKLTEEQVREEAAKHNMTLDPRHFVEVEKKSGRPAKEPKEPKELKAKGRPKKSKKVLELAGEEEDLFASLVMSASKNIEEDVIEETVTSEVSSEADDNSSLGDVDVVVDAKSKPKTDKKPKVSAEEKAALAEQKKLALAEQKKQEAEQKKLEAEQKKIALAEQKKLEAEVKKFALAEQKKAEAEQKKLEAEQKKQALAEQKKQEAEQKKLALAEQKKLALAEQKKPAEKKVATKKTKVDDDDRPSPAFVDPPAEEADVVKKIMFEGKKYLKSKNTGIIYNMEQDVIGKWNEAKNRIDFDVADEESEDEYDEDM